MRTPIPRLLPLVSVMGFAIAAIAATGCSTILKDLPAGSNVQVSTTGFRFNPRSPDAPLLLGQSTFLLQTEPTDDRPMLNRTKVIAPGIDITSTAASGDVGDELQKAGGPEALRELLQNQSTQPSRGGALDSLLPGPYNVRNE